MTTADQATVNELLSFFEGADADTLQKFWIDISDEKFQDFCDGILIAYLCDHLSPRKREVTEQMASEGSRQSNRVESAKRSADRKRRLALRKAVEDSGGTWHG